jgi:cruciform cutting endonuclease 1
MAPRAHTITAKALQALLTRIGSASSGTKDVLQERFGQDVARSRLLALRPEWKQRFSEARDRKLNIVSIDMGIKNLAYCHVEVDYPDGNIAKPTMNIVAWDKLNLVDATKDWPRHHSTPLFTRGEDAVNADEEVDPYSLSVLSRTAYWFIQKPVLEFNPDIILIERQRWRSASSAAIQQWTVRVNTLEAMLWAVLETVRTQRKNTSLKKGEAAPERDFEVFGVDPKRVGQYWLMLHAKAMAEKRADIVPTIEEGEVGSGDVKATKKEPRSKAEKKAKIALLRSWLTGEYASTASTTPKSTATIAFTIGQGAVLAREALRLPAPRSTHKRKKVTFDDLDVDNTGEASEKWQQMKKLDDITDCFLQVAAWVAWESNRLPLMKIWEQRRVKDGVLPPLNNEIMLNMVKQAGEQ